MNQGDNMKTLLATITLLVAMTSTYANSTHIEWIRGNSEAEVEQRMMARVQKINSRRRIVGCENPKVYSVSAPKKSYRANRRGELEVRWTSVIKMSCTNDD
jgi:hypothetical protein